MAGVAVFPYQIGPYDKNANTYYNVGSLNGWTERRSLRRDKNTANLKYS
jgi:hypothetical protein